MGTTPNVTNPLQNVDVQTLQRALEESRSPLIITDNQQKDNPIIYSNQAFLDLTGYAKKDVIGENCRFLQGKDTDPKTVTQLREAVTNGEYLRVSLKNYKKDGTMFWNDLVMSPIKDGTGTVTHFMGMQLDITDRVLAEERLLSKTAELEQSNHELELFTYATSHDLQEPLRMISSYLQLIYKRYGQLLDEDGITFIGYATEGAERLQNLISDLLMLSRVSTTSETFRRAKMAKLVDRALFNLKVAVDETKAKITVEDLPELEVDVVQMTQLFQNLIGNAIKYRSKHAPRITISAVKNATDYTFSVSDNGIGIEQKHFDRIFSIFQRLHTRAEYAGTGIGLAICCRIVERHGGRLWVESTIGKGSTFKFTIPVKGKAAHSAQIS